MVYKKKNKRKQNKKQNKRQQNQRKQNKRKQNKRKQNKRKQNQRKRNRRERNIDLSILNQYFDKIYVINLKKDKEKWKRTSRKLNRLKIRYVRFNAVNGKKYIKQFKNIKKTLWNNWEIENKRQIISSPGIYGCILSHQKIINDAKINNYRRILIFEDDIFYHKNIEKMQRDMIRILDMEWKLIYLGGSQHRWTNVLIQNGYYYANKTNGTFAYGIDMSIYDEILELIKHPKYPIDYYYNSYFQKKYLCPVIYPQLFIADLYHSGLNPIKNKVNLRRKFKKLKWNYKKYV